MSLPRPLRAVVTAGGTEEPVDDVRTLGNVSSGRFGAAIARALDRRGVATTLVASRALAARPIELRGHLEVVPFRGFADLDRILAGLEADPPDLLFMAAAVSDFAPAPTSGKIASDVASLDLHLVKNPKLLARLRAALGHRVVLVGFKLLSGVSPEELERVARAQARAASLDLTVANDLAELIGDRHPVLLVPPEGEAERVDAHREDVADALVAQALAIADRRQEAAAVAPAVERPRTLDAALRDVADRLGYPDGARAIRARGDGASLLLDAIAGADAIVAVDDAVGRFDAVLADEATSDEGLRAALAEAACRGRWNGGPFAVELAAGGALLGLDARAAAALDRGMADAVAALARQHQVPDDALRGARPILDGPRVAGVVVATAPGVIAPFVAPAARGRGLGDAVARALAARGATIAVPETDAAFFVERGFRRGAVGMEGELAPGPGGEATPLAAVPPGLTVLSPPDRAAAIAAVSVALVDPLRRRVLLGRRRAAPYDGRWAFPGGKVTAGEDPVRAARRELVEETGIALPAELAPRLVTPVLAGDGARVFAIESLAFLVLDAPAPRATDEMDAAWVSIDAARALRPITAGTRLVLGRIAELLGRA